MTNEDDDYEMLNALNLADMAREDDRETNDLAMAFVEAYLNWQLAIEYEGSDSAEEIHARIDATRQAKDEAWHTYRQARSNAIASRAQRPPS